ncbi:MAG TPA: hypothetical protein VGG28_04405 [Kofleriaceae bacterium]|jgi:hypothetical protein
MAALDVRVACPFCGAPIHPVAGRCKHCKQDLNVSRATRPSAQAPLPALNGNGNAHYGNGHANIAATYINPMAAAVPALDPGGGSILPPRPTGRSVAVAGGSPLRSWPVVVIGVAAVAIIAAVAIMVWPPSKPNRAAHDPHELQPPPAPERMDSDPLPDPSTQQHSQAEPPAPRHTPDPLPVQPAPRNIDPQDPFGSSPGGLSGLSPLNGIAGADMMMAVMGHACARLKSCPDADESVRDMCDMFSSYSRTAKAPDCDAARQCLEMIDKLDCSAAATPAALMTTIPSCLKAETSC